MAKRRNGKEMERLLARRRRRGLTWAELSEETGVPRSTLEWWQRRLRDGDDRTRDPEFVEVTVMPPAARAGAIVPIEVILRSGHRVSVVPGFDAEHLRRVVDALESGC